MASSYLNKLWHHHDQVETWYYFSIYRLWSHRFWWRRGYSDVTCSLPTIKNLWDLPILRRCMTSSALIYTTQKVKIKSTIKRIIRSLTPLLFKACKWSVCWLCSYAATDLNDILDYRSSTSKVIISNSCQVGGKSLESFFDLHKGRNFSEKKFLTIAVSFMDYERGIQCL